MPKYIDVDVLKANHGMKNACSECDKEVSGFSKSCQYDTVYTLMDFCGWLDDMPTVQLEIIRCKDCRHMYYDSDFGTCWCNRLSGTFRVRENSFCSFAKRRTDE